MKFLSLNCKQIVIIGSFDAAIRLPEAATGGVP